MIDTFAKQLVAPDLLKAITASKIDKKSNRIEEDRCVRDGKAGIDACVTVIPEALLQIVFENKIDGDYSHNPDGFDHHTFVASVATGGHRPGHCQSL